MGRSSFEAIYQHRRTKKYTTILIGAPSQAIGKQFMRWIEIQLNKHGWYVHEWSDKP